jgi:hypothetical protein
MPLKHDLDILEIPLLHVNQIFLALLNFPSISSISLEIGLSLIRADRWIRHDEKLCGRLMSKEEK